MHRNRLNSYLEHYLSCETYYKKVFAYWTRKIHPFFVEVSSMRAVGLIVPNSHCEGVYAFEILILFKN